MGIAPVGLCLWSAARAVAIRPKVEAAMATLMEIIIHSFGKRAITELAQEMGHAVVRKCGLVNIIKQFRNQATELSDEGRYCSYF